MAVCIVGWAHTPFGRLEGRDAESLIVDVAQGAIAHAGVSPADIDDIYLGQFNGGFSPQEFPSSLALQADEALRFKRATRVENACATGSAAIYQGIAAIEARRSRLVLALGVEKMTDLPRERVAEILLRGCYLKEESDNSEGFAGIFARICQLYFQRYGEQSDAMARIAAKNHRNGMANPWAHIRKDFGYEFCRTVSEKNPIVAAPLKRTDCSTVSDGGAAVVLADVPTALALKRAVVFRAAQHVNDFLPMSRRDVLAGDGMRLAFARAYEEARVALADLSFSEVHDCFTIAELMTYEAMGLTAPGEGARAALEGWTQKDGRLPVNPSGGLKAKGHPIGATGVSMHALAAMQLCDEAAGMQIPDARLGLVFNMGGTGVANYVSILERIH